VGWLAPPGFYQLKRRHGYKLVDATGYLAEGLESINKATA
jgi:hypothetical protein